MKPNPAPFLVAIVGGSGSGKSWLAEKLQAALGDNAARIALDDFYRDQSHVPEEKRDAINFDHPDAIDWASLETSLQDLIAGRAAQCPSYDFKTHCRDLNFHTLAAKPVLLVEGLWLLHRPTIRRLFDLKIFIECPVQTRLRRRIDRDLLARGRSREAVEKQFHETVDPMHREFVAPQKPWADVILPHDLSEPDARQLAQRLAERLGIETAAA